MSEHVEPDPKVRDILDRVAAGHLSTEEAAILIAALPRTAASPSEPSGTTPSAEAPSADSGTTPAGGAPSTGEPPSAEAEGDVWAQAVAAAASAPTPAPDTSSAEPQDTARPAESKSAEALAEAEGAQAAVEADAAEAERAEAEQGAPAAAEAEGAEAETGATSAEGETGARGADESASAGDEADAEEVEYSALPTRAGLQRVTVRAIGRRVRLIGEPAISGVAVDGPHVVKREGDTLSINSEGDMGVSLDGFSVLRTRSVGDIKSQVVGGIAKELSVRVNPSLEVEVEITAGSVSAERLPKLTKVRVTAGTAKVADVDGPIDLLVQAGSATLDAQLTKGRSRVRVETGAATVNLRRGSDVRVHSEAQLGKVSWTGAVNGPSKDVEIGQGRSTLDVQVLVGTAQLVTD